MGNNLSELIQKAIKVDSEYEKLSGSRKVATKAIYAAFLILKESGGQLPGREVINKIREIIEFSDWEKAQYEKTGYIRWESILHFYTIDTQKAGYLRKQGGFWILTVEGEKAIELGLVKLLDTASAKYRVWAADNKKDKDNLMQDADIELEKETNQLQKANLDQLEEQAIQGLKDFISQKNPYEFQDMVAALLRAMGYYTPFISPRGKDGGVDILAYQDPLGTKMPRIKVQVKHKPESSVPVAEIRSLLGLLNKEGDVGLFVTSGNFTSESERSSRDSHIHIKLIDFENFILLWKKFYDKLTDEEKNMLPLYPIYFLGSNE